ncbi:uncharacterized protein LOC118754961 [Rhagoletis pomonella]|uniref:uncharacterized protein LOC118754961 n=1 Tax=Rhagoletis pomonella TaxID=28610 RepID=UPI0017843616|nr:uncharacterized protein LOC118754961 [Rhagoletis pomonella]
MKTQMANINAHNVGEEGTLFRVLPVVLHAGANSVSTYAFIDDGSSLTLIDEELLQQLNVKGTPQPLYLRWTGDAHRYEDDSVTLDLAISSKLGNENLPLKAVHSVKKLDLPTQSLDGANLKAKFKYLRGLPLQSYNNVTSKLLIGLNNATLGSAIKSRLGDDYAPISEKTKLGWTVKGHRSIALQGATQYVYHICDCSEHKELRQVVKSHICLDNLGVVANIPALMSKDDELSVEQLEQHTVRVGDRFQTSLLWKHPNMQLPDSLPMAKYRAKCLLKKMQRDPKLAEQLQNKIANYLRKGYARRMTSEDAAAKRYWYLPVFAVSNANKPGKVRLVWDAAATVNGVSLNTMLFAGPDLTTPLLSVLFKFRQKRVGITADIEEMFHQVRIRPADQTFLRFLWYEQNNTERDDVRVEMFSELRSICKKNKNAAEFRDQFPRAARCIVENHYVDDMLDSVDTDEEAVQLALNIQYIHSKGGFHIRNFLSNSDRVLKALNVRSDKALCLNFESELPTEKVLGMWWIASTDHFTFRVSAKYKESNLLVYQRRPTKREVLSLVMTIYNPLGLIGFYVIFAKIILQEIWRSACGIPDEQFTKWLRWIRLIPKIENMRIPRNYIRTEFDSPPQIELHTFVDASESSYAAVSYMRYSDGKIVDCAMVSSKTRVAPLKVMSIPRLELKAALLGARLSKHVRESHSISIATSTYWSDSQTVTNSSSPFESAKFWSLPRWMSGVGCQPSTMLPMKQQNGMEIPIFVMKAVYRDPHF